MSLICTPSAAAPSPAPAQASQAATTWRGDQGGRVAPGSEVVMDARHWNDLWRRLRRDTPPFDFTQAIAVVAYAGEKATSGYAIRFLEPVAQGDDLRITWLVLPPPADSMNAQVLTYPWEVQAFPRPKGKVLAEESHLEP